MLNKKGSIVIGGAFLVSIIGTILLLLIVEISLFFAAHNQVSLIVESAAQQAAGTATYKTVVEWHDDERGVVHEYMEIDSFNEAEEAAKRLINNYKDEQLYNFIEVDISEAKFVPLIDDGRSPNHLVGMDGIYNLYEVQVTAHVKRLFFNSGEWDVLDDVIFTIKAEAAPELRK